MPTSLPKRQCYVASITAFDRDGRFDSEGQRLHFKRMAAAGVSAVVGSSGAGEGYTLSESEWHQLLEIGREELKGRVRFDLMGMEARSARQMIDLYDLACEHDIDGIHIYCVEVGHGSRPDEREVEEYLRTVLSHVEHPSTICNQPQMVGYELPVSLVSSLVADFPQIVGVLDTSRDARYLAEIRAACGDGLELITTIDQAISLLALGGHGFACGEANIAPKLCASVVEHFAAGEYEQCFESYRLAIALNRVIARAVPASSQVHTYKAALRELGLPGGGGMRPPRRWLDEADQRRLGEGVAVLGIPELEGRPRG